MATQSNKSKGKTEKATPIPAAKAPPPPAKPVTKPAPAATKAYEPTPEEIQTRAFEIYVSEGCKEGSDLENWLRAEKELRARGSR
jgi:hypothetical protein